MAIFTIGFVALATAAMLENSKQKASEVIKLPEPHIDDGISVEKALKERRAIRRLTDEPLTQDEISQLLWAAQGITDIRAIGPHLRQWQHIHWRSIS